MTALTFHVERDIGPCQSHREYALDVTYLVNPYYAATHLQPAEGGDCEIGSVLHDGEEFDLTQSEKDALQVACIEHAIDRHDDEADARHEQARDRQMDDDWERDQ